MTTIDRDVLRSRLDRLGHYLRRIEEKRPSSLSELVFSHDLQDILTKNIESAVQVCLDIAMHVCAARARSIEKASDAFDVLAELGLIQNELAGRMVRAVGFRNVSVHRYIDTDWTIVMQIVESGVADLKEFARWAATLAVEPAP
ncbi:MAG: type VII toxin-antitoxin system HepT family RNase toxin [Burkholderiales bacterium]